MPRWVPEQAARVIHAELLAEHDGLHGPSRERTLEAALARPQNLAAYGKPSLPELAACYGVAIARGHCFPDGNKRLALASIDVFLQLNGYELVADEAAAVVMIRDVAAGAVSEEELARWVAANIQRLPRSS